MPPARPRARTRGAPVHERDVFDFGADDLPEQPTPPRRRNKRSIIDGTPAVQHTSAPQLEILPETSSPAGTSTALAHRGPGRPRKSQQTDESPPTRRGPGRPRKAQKTDDSSPTRSESKITQAPEPDDSPPARRGPGRPRKTLGPDDSSPVRRGPGRPRKVPEPDDSPRARRGPGRPRKVARPEDSPPVRRGPGRPRKAPEPDYSTSVRRGHGSPRTALLPDDIPLVHCEPEHPQEALTPDDSTPTRRGPGRPRKFPTSDVTAPMRRGPGHPHKASSLDVSTFMRCEHDRLLKSAIREEPPPIRRVPGRPRKSPLPEENSPMRRGPGRPCKATLPLPVIDDPPPVRRGPGRPCKPTLPVSVLDDRPLIRRGPGRPRKAILPLPVLDDPPPIRRGPGRPRKASLTMRVPDESSLVRRGPGRPRKVPVPNEYSPVHRGPGRPRKVKSEDDILAVPTPVASVHRAPETSQPDSLLPTSEEPMDTGKHNQSSPSLPGSPAPQALRPRRGRSKQLQNSSNSPMENTTVPQTSRPRGLNKTLDSAPVSSANVPVFPSATYPRRGRNKPREPSPTPNPQIVTPPLRQSRRSTSSVKSTERSLSPQPPCDADTPTLEIEPTAKPRRRPGRPRKAQPSRELPVRRVPLLAHKATAESVPLATNQHETIIHRAAGPPLKKLMPVSPSAPNETGVSQKREQSTSPQPAAPSQPTESALLRHDRNSARLLSLDSSPAEQEKSITLRRSRRRKPSPTPLEQETAVKLNDSSFPKVSPEEESTPKQRSSSRDVLPQLSPNLAPTRRGLSRTCTNSLQEQSKSDLDTETEDVRGASHRIRKQPVENSPMESISKRMGPATKKRKLVDSDNGLPQKFQHDENNKDIENEKMAVKEGSNFISTKVPCSVAQMKKQTEMNSSCDGNAGIDSKIEKVLPTQSRDDNVIDEKLVKLDVNRSSLAHDAKTSFGEDEASAEHNVGNNEGSGTNTKSGPDPMAVRQDDMDVEIANTVNSISVDTPTNEKAAVMDFLSNLIASPATNLTNSNIKEANCATFSTVIEAAPAPIANSTEKDGASDSITFADVINETPTNESSCVKRIENSEAVTDAHFSEKYVKEKVVLCSATDFISNTMSNVESSGDVHSSQMPSDVGKNAIPIIRLNHDVTVDSMEKEKSECIGDGLVVGAIVNTMTIPNSAEGTRVPSHEDKYEASLSDTSIADEDSMPTLTALDIITSIDDAVASNAESAQIKKYHGNIGDTETDTQMDFKKITDTDFIKEKDNFKSSEAVNTAMEVTPCTNIEPCVIEEYRESESIAVGIVSDLISYAAFDTESSTAEVENGTKANNTVECDGAKRCSTAKNSEGLLGVSAGILLKPITIPMHGKESIPTISKAAKKIVAVEYSLIETEPDKTKISKEVVSRGFPQSVSKSDLKNAAFDINQCQKEVNNAVPVMSNTCSQNRDASMNTNNEKGAEEKERKDRRTKRSILTLTHDSSSKPDEISEMTKTTTCLMKPVQSSFEQDGPAKCAKLVQSQSLLLKRLPESNVDIQEDVFKTSLQRKHHPGPSTFMEPSNNGKMQSLGGQQVVQMKIPEPRCSKERPLVESSQTLLSQSDGDTAFKETEPHTDSVAKIPCFPEAEDLESETPVTKLKRVTKKTVTFAEQPTEIPIVPDSIESISSASSTPSLDDTQGMNAQEKSDASSLSTSSLFEDQPPSKFYNPNSNETANHAARLSKRPASHVHLISEGATDIDQLSNVGVSGRKPPRLATKRRRVRFDPLPESTPRSSMHLSRGTRRGGPSQLPGLVGAQRVVKKPCTPEEKRSRRALLDQFQYLLDGAFQQGKGKRSSIATDSKLKVDSLLQMLRLLRQTPAAAARPGAAQLETEDSDAVLIACLREHPALLQTLVQNLLHLRESPTPIPLLAMAILLVIVQGTGSAGLFTEIDVESLVEAFFRFSCLPTSHRANQGRNLNEPRRRGLTARRKKISSRKENVLDVVKDMLSDESLVSSIFLDPFFDEVQCANVVAGFVLSKVLEGSEHARDSMMLNNRLARIAKVMYIASSAVNDFGQKLQEEDKLIAGGQEASSLYTKRIQKKKEARTLLGVAMRIFESATLHEEVQKRLVKESKVTSLTVKCIREILCVDELSEAEGVASCAIRLCINLTQGGSLGLTQFLNSDGVQATLDCLAREAGTGLPGVPEQRMFDVRVLCLALLSSVVDQSQQVRDSFQDVAPSNTRLYEGGALAFILSLLKSYGNSSDGVVADLYEDNPLQGTTAGDDTPESKDEMEKRVSTGYLCLVLGALVQNCRRNSTAIRRAVPGNCLLTLAGVIDEFLDFHHEIGLFSDNIDAMYDRITKALNEEELALKETPECVERDSADSTESMTLSG